MGHVRYEILLPLRYNDGSPDDNALLEQTREELLVRFDGVTFEPTILIGAWVQDGIRYDDPLVLLYVDCENTGANKQYFRNLKETLKKRFDQLEVRITTFRIEVI